MTTPIIGRTRNPIQQTNGKEHHVKKESHNLLLFYLFRNMTSSNLNTPFVELIVKTDFDAMCPWMQN